MEKALVILAVALGLTTGCMHRVLVQRFVLTDPSFTPSPHSTVAMILIDRNEVFAQPVFAQPPLRAVGVLQVSGPSKKTINEFLTKIADAGAELGCDALI